MRRIEAKSTFKSGQETGKSLAEKALPAQKIVLRFAPLASVVLFKLILGEEKMAIIADVASIGTALAAVIFSLWVIKQLFTGK